MICSKVKKEFQCDIQKLWDIITNNCDYQWRSDLLTIEIIDETHFVEVTKNKVCTYFTITFKDELKEYRFDIENKVMKGKWIGTFHMLPNGNTQLEFEEKIEVQNFMMKMFAKAYLKKQQKRYMHDLACKVYKK